MIRSRDYLSWSQYSLWTKSKLSYWKQYGLNEEQKPNKFFNKGNELGEALEHGESFSSDTMIDKLLTIVPRLDIMEDKIEVELVNGEKILGFADSASLDNMLFLEYKSGKEPWTQLRVEEHEQLLFYALGYYIKNGRLGIPISKLIWVETEETEEGLKFTGNTEEFDRTFTEQEVLDFEMRLVKVCAEIDEWEYTEMEVEDEFIDRYNALLNQQKEIQSEIAIMKLTIEDRMIEEGVDYAKGMRGRFGFTKRKTWTYSKETTEIANKFKKGIAAKRKEEIKDGIATFTESKSLNYSAIN